MKGHMFFRKYSPTILSVIGSIGVIGTSILAVKSTPKALALIEKYRDDSEELKFSDKVKVTWTCYIPATVAGICTITCIFGSNILSKNNQTYLIGAYTLLDQSYKRYKEAAKSVYGDGADSNIKAEVAKKVYISENLFGRSIFDNESNDEEFLFYDDYSKRYFTSTMASVLNAQYHINRNFALRGDTNVNEFYTFLGIDGIPNGDEIGWDMENVVVDGIVWLDFENRFVKMDDGIECYILSTDIPPRPFVF